MNRKAFTLTETIAVITILGILLLIAVPSISNLSKTTEKKRILEDAKLFIALAKEKIQSDTSYGDRTIEIDLNEVEKKRLGSSKYTSGTVIATDCDWDSNNNVFKCNTYEVTLENDNYKVSGQESSLNVEEN